jgi:hypothetical protein
MNDEFYIGWEKKAAPGLSRANRFLVIGLLTVALLVAALLATAQHLIGVSVFEWGAVKKFSGILEMYPYPHLVVPRPGLTGGQAGYSSYYLVAPFKHGLDRGRFSPLDGKNVSLQGTLIYRGNQTMVEAIPESIKAEGPATAPLAGTETVRLGRQTLSGEIVDCKCYLGVMNPGQLLPHRACAIRCISGGIPPVLLVRPKDGPTIYLLLVSSDGKPVNQQVLDLVAEPLEITGDVERQGDLLIMRSDPATYRRIKP